MRCESCAAAQENARNRVRMARRRTAAPGDLTTAEVRELLDAAAACPICGVEMDDTGRGSASKSIDHVVPVSQGGENTLSNVRVVCFGCNARAGLRLREEASA
jgi:5-methylcytosine-specific restriction endonuclease McrA